ncbi:aminoacyl--tRNA ligase-related protein [Nocardiopsis halotolerans]|uniref:aminoacyl--tRNA ligase-related protein n=1 Tax=Nocardiopsis halotolerans TaxID=124252 RepID=UPI000345F1BC|nr:aminoacyl--tRNA ligase-related protein [Nocardiopsis halotolerans]
MRLLTGLHEQVVDVLREGLADAFAPYRPSVFWGPPVISRSAPVRAGYADSFPHLLAEVGAARPGEGIAEEGVPASGGDSGRGRASGLVLVPAACHHVYTMLSGREVASPSAFTTESPCFRDESTTEHGRLLSFRQREAVFVAEPKTCVELRESSLERVRDWLTGLGIRHTVEAASDPFFGPGKRLLKASQREQRLKWEFHADTGGGRVQALGSSNHHKDHFTSSFSIRGPEGAPVHTSCVGFGLERVVLALIAAHGPDPANWPFRVGDQRGNDDSR